MSHETVQEIFLSLGISRINYCARLGHYGKLGEKMCEIGRLYEIGLRNGIFCDKLDLTFK